MVALRGLTFELTGVQKQSEAALLHVRVERIVMPYASIPIIKTGMSMFDVPRCSKSHANCSK